MIRIHPYKLYSASARALKEKLNERGQRTVVSHRAGPTVVGWGCRDFDFDIVRCLHVLNNPTCCKVFVNKLSYFRQCGESSAIPKWTTDIEVARSWPLTVERHVLNGTNGDGIRLATADALQPAPLYVKYRKKSHEFRLHICREGSEGFKVFHAQRKVARDPETIDNWQVRNTSNGFFYQQHGFDVPSAVRETALGLMSSSFPSIDFVALDVIYSESKDQAWVIEGNTAPGMTGSTVDAYCDMIQEILQ